jgi:hypothetical protein
VGPERDKIGGKADLSVHRNMNLDYLPLIVALTQLSKGKPKKSQVRGSSGLGTKRDEQDDLVVPAQHIDCASGKPRKKGGRIFQMSALAGMWF